MSPGPEPTYHSYLRLADLLAQQHPLASPAAHDELLFITVHQTFELWFKVMLFELTDARDRMLAGDISTPCARLRRCHAISRTVLHHFDVIDTMPPRDFAAFRDSLGRASGAQSAQHLEIEYLSGLRDRRSHDGAGFTDAECVRLSRRLAEPNLWDGFLTVLRTAGYDVSAPAGRAEAYLRIADERESCPALWGLLEALIDHDQLWSLWRMRHALVVERQIGTGFGTGGSDGAAHLRASSQRHFYPELWEAAGRITALAGR